MTLTLFECAWSWLGGMSSMNMVVNVVKTIVGSEICCP